MDNQNPIIPPPLQEEFEMVKWILETLRANGLNFLLMGLAVWHLQLQNMDLRKDISNCQAGQIEFLTSKNEQLMKALDSNTNALNRISDAVGPDDFPSIKRRR